MDNYIYAINHALKYASLRMSWYEDTKDSRYLYESMDWVDVARIYMKEIKGNCPGEVEDFVV
jgi:hypothetical protein